MKEKNLTALMSCYIRCYHYKNNKYKILNDNIAEKILTPKEYQTITTSLIQGIKYFNPNHKKNNKEALNEIMNKQLSPSVLVRSIFCETALHNAIKLGCKQYLIFASGYDTYAYRTNKKIKIFEIDKKEIINDKLKRLKKQKINHSKITFIKCDFTEENWINNLTASDYTKDELSFSSLLGISYYLTKKEFSIMIQTISQNIANGSSILFDYPTYEKTKNQILIQNLAKSAKEPMKSKYTYQEIEQILEENNMLIYEHLNYKEITNNYLETYNALNPNNKIIAPQGVNYCLAVKIK